MIRGMQMFCGLSEVRMILKLARSEQEQYGTVASSIGSHEIRRLCSRNRVREGVQKC